MTYMSAQQKEWVESPKYSLMKYRSEKTQNKEDVINDFMMWLKYDCEAEPDPQHIEDLKHLFSLYLGLDIEKVVQGEKEMLEQWKNSCKGVTNEQENTR